MDSNEAGAGLVGADRRLIGSIEERRRYIAVRAAATVPVTLLFVAMLAWSLPPVAGPVDMPLRLAVAARASALAALPLAAAVLVIGARRARSGAHNPLLGEEDPALRIHVRVLANSLEQWALFVAGAGSTATLVSDRWLHVVPMLGLVFVVARAVFWVGYLQPGNVLGRVPGVAMTWSVTVPLLACGAAMTLWSWVSGGW